MRAVAAIGDSADGGDPVRQGRYVTTRADQFMSFDSASWFKADNQPYTSGDVRTTRVQFNRRRQQPRPLR